MKLIHAADIHLDSPMRGLARYDGAPVEQLRLSTRTALANLVDLAIDEDADALLIAGDLFDGDWLDYGTGAHFAQSRVERLLRCLSRAQRPGRARTLSERPWDSRLSRSAR